MGLTDKYNRRLYVCLPRQQRSAEWVEQVLRHLWDYGMNFPSFQLDGHQPLTWNGLLSAIDIEMGESETFRTQIAQLARSGGSVFTAYEFGGPSLSFNLGKHASLDWLVLSLRGAELEPYWNRQEEQYETPLGYLAVYQAFVEWSKALCEIVEPLFGFGYCESYLTNFDQYYEYVNIRGEVPQSAQLPPIDDWFSHPPLRYFAPSLLSSDLQHDLLARERWQIERLKAGGLFVTPPSPEYTAIAYGGYNALKRGIQGDSAARELPVPVSESVAELERALTIFTEIDERNGIRKAKTYLL